VDVSSAWLDASIGRTGNPQRFANTSEGIAELAALCHDHRVDLVAMEATGGYERQAFAERRLVRFCANRSEVSR
jgi:transposase